MRYRTLLKRLSKTTTVDALDKRAKVRVMATYYSHGEPHARIIVDARVTNVHAQDNGQPLIAAELDEAQPLIAAALDEANLREKLAEKGAPHEHAREVRFYPRAVDGPHAPPDYRYMVDVIMPWLPDADGLPRMEHGHGETEEEAWKVARAIAAAFMYEDTVGAEEWPQNSIDHVAPQPQNYSDDVPTYEQVIRCAHDLIESGENFEYTRGIAELIADAFGYRTTESYMDDAKRRIATDLGLASTYFDGGAPAEEAELRAAFDALVAQGAHESNDGFRLLRRARQLSLDGLASDIRLWLMYAPVEDNPQTGDAS